jgi:hypothetical protein
MREEPRASWRHVRKQFLFALALTLFALFVFSLFSNSNLSSGGFRSAELKFTDASARGLAIVPASCPSSPHSAGECEGGAGAGAGSFCSIGASPSAVQAGQSATLTWAADTTFGFFTLNTSGSIDPGIGSVSPSGTQIVSPPASTIYMYHGTQSLFGVPVRNFSCSVQISVNAPAGGGFTGGACFTGYYCSGSDLYIKESCRGAGQLIQTCAFGCSGAACLAPPPPSGNIRAIPQLVRSGDVTNVSWSAANVSSCTVSGTDSDSWSGASGSQVSSKITGQTIFTLTCTGLDGSTLTQSATVNIIPIFQEK